MPRKIVLITLYFGQWPVWFPAFLQSCKYNPTIDWLLFTDCVIPEAAPGNVRFIPYSMIDFSALASDKLGLDIDLSRPYKVCDFRPAFGVIFEEYVKNYAFWGHGDLDIIWGDIRQFITDETLEEYDIISARKGIMCGHFSLYRNTAEISTIFTRHPNHQTIFQSPQYHAFDEAGITKMIKALPERGTIKTYWPTFLLNFANPPNDKPGVLGRYRNRWYWERGKLYEQVSPADEGKSEVMYLHFMTWKKSMTACYFEYVNNPPSFYISYSHIGLTKSDPSPPGSSFIWYRTRASWGFRRTLRRLRSRWKRTQRRLRPSRRTKRV